MQLMISFYAVNNVQSRVDTEKQVQTITISLIDLHYKEKQKEKIVGYGSCFVISINDDIPLGIILAFPFINRPR